MAQQKVDIDISDGGGYKILKPNGDLDVTDGQHFVHVASNLFRCSAICISCVANPSALFLGISRL